MTSASTTTTKKELVQRIAEETGQTKAAARDVIQALLDMIIGDLAEGNRIEFREFGIFELKHREARIARNPRTNAPVEVPAQRQVKFKPGSRMRERIAVQDQGQPAPPKAAPEEASKAQQAQPLARPTPAPPKAPPPTSPDSPF